MTQTDANLRGIIVFRNAKKGDVEMKRVERCSHDMVVEGADVRVVISIVIAGRRKQKNDVKKS